MAKKQKKQFPLLPTVIFILIASIVLAFLLPTLNKKAVEKTLDKKELLTELATKLEVMPELRDSPYWSWVDEEKQIIPLTGVEFFIGTVNINGIGKYKNINSDDLSKITPEFLDPIMADTSTFFINKGFTKNAFNSSDKPDDFGTLFSGFEMGSLKCIAMLSVQSDPFGRFFCGVIDESQLTLQKEFKDVFAMPFTQGQRPPLLRIEKVVGNYALGNYAEGAGPGGYTFMAKKTNDLWEVVWRGQEIAQCTDMQKYDIPKEIYGECYTNP